jgi:hypothetical protein
MINIKGLHSFVLSYEFPHPRREVLPEGQFSMFPGYVYPISSPQFSTVGREDMNGLTLAPQEWINLVF